MTRPLYTEADLAVMMTAREIVVCVGAIHDWGYFARSTLREFPWAQMPPRQSGDAADRVYKAAVRAAHEARCLLRLTGELEESE